MDGWCWIWFSIWIIGLECLVPQHGVWSSCHSCRHVLFNFMCLPVSNRLPCIYPPLYSSPVSHVPCVLSNPPVPMCIFLQNTVDGWMDGRVGVVQDWFHFEDESESRIYFFKFQNLKYQNNFWSTAYIDKNTNPRHVLRVSGTQLEYILHRYRPVCLCVCVRGCMEYLALLYLILTFGKRRKHQRMVQLTNRNESAGSSKDILMPRFGRSKVGSSL